MNWQTTVNECEPKGYILPSDGITVLETVAHRVDAAGVSDEEVVQEVVGFVSRELPNTKLRSI